MASKLSRVGRLGLFRLVNTSIKQQVRQDGIFTKYREPPNGFLFNRKPLKPGEKFVWEDWFIICNVGLAIFLITAGVRHYYDPPVDMNEWARREALIRIAEIEAAEASAVDGDETE